MCKVPRTWPVSAGIASSVRASFLSAMPPAFFSCSQLLPAPPEQSALGGIPVHIQLYVRRFFCRAVDCEQAIFTERLPHTVLRYARRTCRLSKTIRQIAMALDGEGG